jgi:hypothetical protein
MVDFYILINRLIDYLLSPLQGLAPFWTLSMWSVIMGVVAMIIYKYTSKQDGIKDAKEKIKGHFFEVWLYIDDAAVIAKSQAMIMVNAFRYMAYAIPPLAIMIVLFFPLFANFEVRYAMRPVPVGEDTLVKLRFEKASDYSDKEVDLKLAKGVELVGHPVKFIRKITESPKSAKIVRRDYEINYKIKPTEEGKHELKFTVGGKALTVPFFAGDTFGEHISPFTTKNIGTALLFPPLTSIPDGMGVESVEIQYPGADFPFLGWDTWWIWPFLIVSMIAAFAVKGVFKVEI